MNLVKLGKRGQVTIPRAILKKVGIADETPLLIAAAPDGSIVLRQAGVCRFKYPDAPGQYPLVYVFEIPAQADEKK